MAHGVGEVVDQFLHGFSKEWLMMSILERLARLVSESNDLKPIQSKEYDR